MDRYSIYSMQLQFPSPLKCYIRSGSKPNNLYYAYCNNAIKTRLIAADAKRHVQLCFRVFKRYYDSSHVPNMNGGTGVGEKNCAAQSKYTAIADLCNG